MATTRTTTGPLNSAIRDVRGSENRPFGHWPIPTVASQLAENRTYWHSLVHDPAKKPFRLIPPPGNTIPPPPRICDPPFLPESLRLSSPLSSSSSSTSGTVSPPVRLLRLTQAREKHAKRVNVNAWAEWQLARYGAKPLRRPTIDNPAPLPEGGEPGPPAAMLSGTLPSVAAASKARGGGGAAALRTAAWRHLLGTRADPLHLRTLNRRPVHGPEQQLLLPTVAFVLGITLMVLLQLAAGAWLGRDASWRGAGGSSVVGGGDGRAQDEMDDIIYILVPRILRYAVC